MRVLTLVAGLLLAASAQAQVTVEKPWVRATAPGAQVGGGYMTMRNGSTATDRLIGASSPAAARVELHIHVRDGEIMRMRQVPGFELPANGSFELKPGGAHLMFMQIRTPFREGERIPVQLRFEKAGEVRVDFTVGRIGDSGQGEHRKH